MQLVSSRAHGTVILKTERAVLQRLKRDTAAYKVINPTNLLLQSFKLFYAALFLRVFLDFRKAPQ